MARGGVRRDAGCPGGQECRAADFEESARTNPRRYGSRFICPARRALWMAAKREQSSPMDGRSRSLTRGSATQRRSGARPSMWTLHLAVCRSRPGGRATLVRHAHLWQPGEGRSISRAVIDRSLSVPLLLGAAKAGRRQASALDPGHTKVESTFRCPGIEVDGTLMIAQRARSIGASSPSAAGWIPAIQQATLLFCGPCDEQLTTNAHAAAMGCGVGIGFVCVVCGDLQPPLSNTARGIKESRVFDLISRLPSVASWT